MPLLHIETDSLRETARWSMLMAEEIDWQVQRMENTHQFLQSSWQGDGRFQFESEMNNRLYTLQRLSRELSTLALRLQREASQWEEIGCQF